MLSLSVAFSHCIVPLPMW